MGEGRGLQQIDSVSIGQAIMEALGLAKAPICLFDRQDPPGIHPIVRVRLRPPPHRSRIADLCRGVFAGLPVPDALQPHG